MGLITVPARPAVPAWRRALRVLCGLVATGAVLVVAARAVGGEQRTPLVQLAVVLPQATVASAVALVVALLVRARRTAALLALLVAVQGLWLAPALGVGVSAPTPAGASGPVRVMTVNSLTGQADARRIVSLARDRDVDLLVTTEITPRQLAEFEREGLGRLLPHRLGRTSRLDWRADGTVLWSRWPIAQTAPFPATAYGQPRGVVTLPSGRALTVTAVHTLSPIPGRVQAWRGEVDAVAQGVAQVAASGGAQLVLGDFNATRDHAGFRRVLAAGGLVDAAEAVGPGRWPGFTWPAHRAPLPPLVRLDHVLVTRGQVGVRDLDTVRIAGTDHLAVVAELVG